MRSAFGCLRAYEDALTTMTVHSLFRAMALHVHQPYNKFNGQKGEVELEFRCGVFHSKRSQRNRLGIDVASPAIIAPNEKTRYEFESGLAELELTSIISHLWNDKLARKSKLQTVTERAYIGTEANKRILYYPFYESAQLESFAETPSSNKEQNWQEERSIVDEQQEQRQHHHSSENTTSDTVTSGSNENIKNMEEKRAMDTINFLRAAARKTARSYKIYSAIAKERITVHDISLPNWSFDMRLALSLEKPIAICKNEAQKEQKLKQYQALHHTESSIPHSSEQNKQLQRRGSFSNEGNELIVLDKCAVSMVSQYLVKTINIHPFFHLQLSRRCDCLDSDVYHLNQITEVITIPTLYRPLLFFHCELEFNIDAIYKEWRRLTGCRLDLPVLDDVGGPYHKVSPTADDARRSAIHEKAIRDPFLRQVASDALTMLQYIGTECT